ncbi:MAG TPA: hypothetical protein VHP35_12730 [Terriglobia bacterium]|jgi:hypothetical protein|nr:hypothetical protein [Terriglobia bacterium]
MPGWIVLLTIMAWVAFLPEIRAETALVPLYQDVLQNCKGASESTRETIIRTALTSGRARTLHVSSAFVQELSDREPDPYPAYVASSVALCGVTVSDPARAASLSEKHHLKVVQRGPTTMATGTLRLVASKRYEDFNVRYIVIVPTRAQFDTFRKGERVSFTAEAVGVRQRPEALEVTAILQSLEPTPAPHPAEALLIARYQDVLKNCEGASQKTRTVVVASALRRAVQNSLAGQEIGVSSAIVLGVFQPYDDRHPALVASSAGLCSVAVNDEDLARSLASKHKFKTKWQDKAAIVQDVLRVVASKQYSDFEVRYTLIAPTGSSLVVPRPGQRISFSALFLGASDVGTLELTGVLTKLDPD